MNLVSSPTGSACCNSTLLYTKKIRLSCDFQTTNTPFGANVTQTILFVILFCTKIAFFRLFTVVRMISAATAITLYIIHKFLSTLFQTMIYFLKHSNSNTAFLMVLPSPLMLSVTFRVLAAATTSIFLFISIVTISVANTLSP